MNKQDLIKSMRAEFRAAHYPSYKELAKSAARYHGLTQTINGVEVIPKVAYEAASEAILLETGA